jgi:hypothetical protein
MLSWIGRSAATRFLRAPSNNISVSGHAAARPGGARTCGWTLRRAAWLPSRRSRSRSGHGRLPRSARERRVRHAAAACAALELPQCPRGSWMAQPGKPRPRAELAPAPASSAPPPLCSMECLQAPRGLGVALPRAGVARASGAARPLAAVRRSSGAEGLPCAAQLRCSMALAARPCVAHPARLRSRCRANVSLVTCSAAASPAAAPAPGPLDAITVSGARTARRLRRPRPPASPS